MVLSSPFYREEEINGDSIDSLEVSATFDTKRRQEGKKARRHWLPSTSSQSEVITTSARILVKRLWKGTAKKLHASPWLRVQIWPRDRVTGESINLGGGC